MKEKSHWVCKPALFGLNSQDRIDWEVATKRAFSAKMGIVEKGAPSPNGVASKWIVGASVIIPCSIKTRRCVESASLAVYSTLAGDRRVLHRPLWLSVPVWLEIVACCIGLSAWRSSHVASASLASCSRMK